MLPAEALLCGTVVSSHICAELTVKSPPPPGKGGGDCGDLQSLLQDACNSPLPCKQVGLVAKGFAKNDFSRH
jgi:hypothetical protein